jgi:hypothetical protein
VLPRLVTAAKYLDPVQRADLAVVRAVNTGRIRPGFLV